MARKYIASVSFGKDSLAMLLMLIYQKYPLHEVVFYDTGMEFNAVYAMRDRVLPLLKKHRITYTELHPNVPFQYKMLYKPVKERGGGMHYGYSWCGGRCRWGTTEKTRALDKYAEERNAFVYVGIAADEHNRIAKPRKPYKLLPLVDWGKTEQEALQYCYKNGFTWEEDGVELYKILDRVSCWYCANKNIKELKNIYRYLPRYWDKLKKLQAQTDRPMKGPGKSVFELEERFCKELEGVLNV